MGNKKKKKLEKALIADSMITFIRACADPRISPKLFAEEPCWLWTPRGDRILWANENGVRFFKTKSLPDLLGRKFRGISPASAEISRIGRSTKPGFQQERRLRYLLGMKSVEVDSRLEHLEIDGIGKTILVSSMASNNEDADRSAKKMRARLMKMCSRGNASAAFVSVSGKFRETSDLFEEMAPGQDKIREIIGLLNEEDETIASLRSGELAITLARLNGSDPSDRELFMATANECNIFEDLTALPNFKDLTSNKRTKASDDAVVHPETEDKEQPEESSSSNEVPDLDDHETTLTNPITAPSETDDVILDASSQNSGASEEDDGLYGEALPSRSKDEEPGNSHNLPVETESSDEDHSDDLFLNREEERFLFELDQTGEFTSVSDEFLTAIGHKTGSILEQNLFELVHRFNLDTDGKIERKFSKKAIWTHSVLWPTSHTGSVGDKTNPPWRVPVGLTAMPVFDRYRNFEGFRGFGVIKLNEASKHSDLEAIKSETKTDDYEDDRDTDWERFLATTPLDEDEGSLTYGDFVIDDDLDLVDTETDEPDVLTPHEPKEDDSFVTQYPDRGQTVSSAPPAEKLDQTPSNKPQNNLSKPEQRAFEQIALALGNGQKKTEEPKVPNIVPEDQQDNADIDFSAASAIEGASNRTKTLDTEPVDENSTIDKTAVSNANQSSVDVDDQTLETPDKPDADNDEISLFLERLPIGVLISRNRKVLFANSKTLHLLGYSDLSGLIEKDGLDDLFLSLEAEEPGTFQDRDILRQLVINADNASGEDPLHQSVRIRKSDNSPLDALVTLQSGLWQNDDALIMTITESRSPGEIHQDNSTSKKAIEGQSTDIMDIAADGILILDRTGMLSHANTSAEVLFGQERDQINGSAITTLFAEESHQTIQDYLDGLTSNGVASVLNDGREVIGREASGGLIPLFMTIGQIGGFDRSGSAMYCAVVRDITQWKAAEEELIHSRKAAEDANAQKSDFLARVSHEIRTPLNAIIGFSEVMMNEHFGPMENARYLEYARDINTSGTLLVSLVNDLLDLSKIEAGKVDLSFSSVSLNTIIQECVAIMQPDANRERIIIRTSMADDLPPVVADPRSIRQIALNLLSNAIKFTDTGGQVIVSTTLERNGEVALRVRDTGIGMSEVDLKHAMQPFQQVAAATRKGQNGTGLGLPLTKALVEANKAQFMINSRPDYGTLIQVTFPNERVLAY